MQTISPPASFSYPLEDPRSHEQLGFYHGETETSESFRKSPTFEQLVIGQSHDESQQFPLVNEQAKTVKMKKMNHNASERDRRKRINGSFSSLRALLPPAYQEKKLSIPATISRVLKYIPELQKEVESLAQKKECLITLITEQQNSSPFSKQSQRNTGLSAQIPLSTVSASQLSDKELIVQISTMKFNNNCSYADVLSSLEQDGFLLLNSSCFDSFDGKVFYNLHLEIPAGAPIMDLEGLKKKLLSLFIKKLEELSLLC